MLSLELEYYAGAPPSLTVVIHLVHHVLQFGLRRILAEGSHYGAQLSCGDVTVAILVKELECVSVL